MKSIMLCNIASHSMPYLKSSINTKYEKIVTGHRWIV